MKRQELIDALLNDMIDQVAGDHSSLIDLLLEGCPGLNNLSDAEIQTEFEERNIAL